MDIGKILLAVLRASPAIIDTVKSRRSDRLRIDLPPRFPGGYPPENGGPGAVERTIDAIRPAVPGKYREGD